MGFINWLMKGIGFEGDEEDALDDSRALEKRQQREQKKREKLAKRQEKKAEALARKSMGNEQYSSVQVSQNVQPSSAPSYSYDRDQFNMQSSSTGSSYGYSSSGMGGYGSKNVVFYYPKSYSEVQKLIDFLRQGESVMLNLDNVSEDEAQRMLDFSSGAVYALNGSVQRVSGNIFLLTPEGLNIMMPRETAPKSE
ncbi:MAG: cell division protein SepF [Clostridia bacterium]|nr:cell division protein SepF [Clostridia bacterium]